MKIAFVGKGGSGKSTVAALFIRYLLDNKQNVLAVDADINQHLAELISAPLRQNLALAKGDSPLEIRNHLRGTNKKIINAKTMVKTTPPGVGSNLVTVDDSDNLLANFSAKFSEHGHFMHVGTYDKDGIGTSCYHTSLAVFENIISHTYTNDSDWVVADMVAGTDAFAGALYLMFDVIFIIVEPTPESTGVYRQFIQLAESAEIADKVFAIGNKVIDNEDLDYLRQAVGDSLVGTLRHNDKLRKNRQKGIAIDKIDADIQPLFAKVEQYSRKNKSDANIQLKKLHRLHRHFASQPFTIKKYGDLSGQIDDDFAFAEGTQK